MNIVNQTVPRALKALGYSKQQIDDIVNHIDVEKTIAGAPHLKDEHKAVFSCSMGDNPIHYLGHVKMMSAVQPFISGAISKTVNMPEDVSVEEVEQLHFDAWEMGLKAVAIYRDNCKVGQPLNMAKKGGNANNEVEEDAKTEAAPVTIKEVLVHGPVKRELPRTRTSKTYEFRLADLKGFFTVGEYEDGTPGELFVNVSKQGSTLSGLMDSFAISVSHGLQFGVPLKNYVKALRGTAFAPSGITDDTDIRTASSITDYIFRRLALDYLSFDDRLELGLADLDDLLGEQTSLLEAVAPAPAPEAPKFTGPSSSTAGPTVSEQKVDAPVAAVSKPASKVAATDSTAPLCYNCGNQTQRAGSCYVCSSCGSTTGCS
jgi:ribonucleoside-diphosphate reductase alpha chain